MKKLLFTLTLLFLFVAVPSFVSAQGMMDSTGSPQVGAQSAVPSDDHTARAAISESEPRLDHTRREEVEGKEIWEKLQAKQLECKDLTKDNYGSLGEYFMGQMVGSSHEAMNTMMEQMMGKESEEQMHVAMGKRLSGCEPNAQVPSGGVGFMPMMFLLRPFGSFDQTQDKSAQGYGGQGMMGSTGSPQVGGGGNSMMGNGWNNMMGGWGGFGILGWLSMLLFWILLILGVVALVRYLSKSRSSQESKTALDILKDRYARGEVDRKEFEEKKKDLL